MSFADGTAAINLDMPQRVPRYEPSAAEYHLDLVAAVTGLPVTQQSTDEQKLRARQAFLRAWNYDIDLTFLTCGYDLNALSTDMGHAVYAKGGADFSDRVPSPFKSEEEVFSLDPWEVYGKKDHAELVHGFNEHYRRHRELYPDTVSTTGIYITLMSGMIQIFGWDMLLTAAGTDPERFGEVVNRYASWIRQYYDALADSEAEVICSHDDMVWTEGAFIHPDWYRKYVFPDLKRLWAPLREAGKKIIFICDGNYDAFAEDVAACGNHGFWFEIFTDLEYMTKRFGKTHVLIGNADSRVLTFGTRADVHAEVERCMAAGKKYPGYFMCVSGHIPPNVPLENALYYNEVYEELSRR